MVRCTVASAGNDHRLGAQEAPPAIISLYPGQGFEAFVESICAGGDLLGYKAEKKKQETGCSAAMHIEANVEDRNRTAPFPFCGNRFEFRAVGSSQNCCLPIMVCNAIMSAGMAHLSSLIEGGMSHRDAVAKIYTEQACDLHRQRLLRGMARRGKQARPAELEHHAQGHCHLEL